MAQHTAGRRQSAGEASHKVPSILSRLSLLLGNQPDQFSQCTSFPGLPQARGLRLSAPEDWRGGKKSSLPLRVSPVDIRRRVFAGSFVPCSGRLRIRAQVQIRAEMKTSHACFAVPHRDSESGAECLECLRCDRLANGTVSGTGSASLVRLRVATLPSSHLAQSGRSSPVPSCSGPHVGGQTYASGKCLMRRKDAWIRASVTSAKCDSAGRHKSRDSSGFISDGFVCASFCKPTVRNSQYCQTLRACRPLQC